MYDVTIPAAQHLASPRKALERHRRSRQRLLNAPSLRDKMAAPSEEMSKMAIKGEAKEQKQSKGGKKKDKKGKDKGEASSHSLEVK